MLRTSVVTDDVRASRELVARWLNELGYETKLEANGDAAWETVIETEPDLAVTDIEMPGMCGLELLREIREHTDERLRKMPVVVISSLQDAALEETAMNLGATAVLAKPLVKTDFQKVINQIRNGELPTARIAEPTKRIQPSGPISPTLRRLIEQMHSRRN